MIVYPDIRMCVRDHNWMKCLGNVHFSSKNKHTQIYMSEFAGKFGLVGMFIRLDLIVTYALSSATNVDFMLFIICLQIWTP